MALELDREVLLQLQFAPLFTGLAEKDVRGLLDGAEVLVLTHEHDLYREGQPVDRFFVVLDGHVELSLEVDGRKSVVEVARRPTVLGDAAMFGSGRYIMSARVLTQARLLAIPAQAFRARLEERMDILLHMLTTMSLRLRMLVRQIAELKLKTTAQRLGSFLLTMTEAEDGRVELRFPYDKRLVADQLGMKPESLSRALGKLARVGVESRPDNLVVIADVERLRDFCAEDEVG
ncbi:cAMP-binding protein [Paramagnetospirillum kuznetsovii]|uniref:cAMP-binding protein n=1 Tax=Paramagnetospirillum kuznetsovii TaxID=2053833 RepID=A0A364NYM7_9PROT|nr:cyclic nucleotide-binding domain-containing protein [Paramagnetospirillum kuznetsovii]RAU22017.1 cAMP-binding protein [Paramagnetospirillum kuznetsovii]